MSRSKKVAIIKDKGHRKEHYWKVHRRVNRQITKYFIDSARRFVYTGYDEWDEFFRLKDYFISKGMSPEEAHYDANLYVEDDVTMRGISGNLYRLWWESPEYKQPKELINDYDYSDYHYCLDYEYRKKKGYFRDRSEDYGSKEWKTRVDPWVEKARRK